MSRALHPGRWHPSCWTVFAVGAIVLALVIAHYTVGAP